jgi:hypothetical protein
VQALGRQEQVGAGLVQRLLSALEFGGAGGNMLDPSRRATCALPQSDGERYALADGR